MITLGELFAWLLVALIVAWLWRGHGVRERALWFVDQHCKNAGVQLLDGNVALKGWRLMRDGKGQKRLARLYGFEFTVTSQERLAGTVAMFGRHLGQVELQAHPIPQGSDDSQEGVVTQKQPNSSTLRSSVVELQHWRDKNNSPD